MIPKHSLTKIAAYLTTPSAIGDHGQACCRDALAWLRGVDAVNSYRDGRWHPPTWLRKAYEWGPIPWPLHWCSVPEMERLDCGALAAVAVQLYRLRGQQAVRLQLALRYPPQVAEQWSRMWQREALSASWITGEFCYHEACGVLEGSRLIIWDPTENRALDPPGSPNDGFGAVVAFRIAELTAGVETLLWEGIPVRSGMWQSVVFDLEGRLTIQSTEPPRAVGLRTSVWTSTASRHRRGGR